MGVRYFAVSMPLWLFKIVYEKCVYCTPVYIFLTNNVICSYFPRKGISFVYYWMNTVGTLWYWPKPKVEQIKLNVKSKCIEIRLTIHGNNYIFCTKWRMVLKAFGLMHTAMIIMHSKLCLHPTAFNAEVFIQTSQLLNFPSGLFILGSVF